MKNIISYVDFKINSITRGSVVIDSSLIFNQDISKDTVSQSIKNVMLSDNILNITSIDIDPSQSNSKWWLPLVIVLPIAFVLFIISLTGLVYFKKRKPVSLLARLYSYTRFILSLSKRSFILRVYELIVKKFLM